MSDNEIKRGSALESSNSVSDGEASEGRINTSSRVFHLRRPPPSVLSPVSEIALTFEESSITTPKTRKQKDVRDGKLNEREFCWWLQFEIRNELVSKNKLHSTSRVLMGFKYSRFKLDKNFQKNPKLCNSSELFDARDWINCTIVIRTGFELH